MKLILHLIAKDQRRMRGWSVVWLVVLALPIALGAAATANRSLHAQWAWLGPLNVALAMLHSLVAYVVVLVLVQEDRVVGTNQFWLTRPIARWRLWVAKFCGAFLLVGGGAVLVGLPWWWWCGFGAAEFGRAALDQALLALAIVVPAMLLSAITDSLGRAILWSFAFFAFFGLWTIPVTASVWAQRVPIAARMGVITSGWLLGAAIVVAALYLTRRRGRILAGAAAGLVLWWFASIFVPVERILEPRLRERNPERGAAVQVHFREASTGRMAKRPGRTEGPPMDPVRVLFAATGADTQLRLQGMGARQTWQWDGVKLTRDDALNVLGGWSPFPDYAFARRSPPARRAGPSSETTSPAEFLLQSSTLVPASYAARMAAERFTFEARLWLALVRPTVQNSVPLQSGQRRRGRAHRIVVEDVRDGRDATTVDLLDLTPGSWTAAVGEAVQGRTWFNPRKAGGYYLVHAPLKEFRTLSWARRRSMAVHGVEITAWQVNIAPLPNESPAELREWLVGARLEYVGVKVESVFSRDVRVPDATARRNTTDDEARDVPTKK